LIGQEAAGRSLRPERDDCLPGARVLRSGHRFGRDASEILAKRILPRSSPAVTSAGAVRAVGQLSSLVAVIGLHSPQRVFAIANVYVSWPHSRSTRAGSNVRAPSCKTTTILRNGAVLSRLLINDALDDQVQRERVSPDARLGRVGARGYQRLKRDDVQKISLGNYSAQRMRDSKTPPYPQSIQG
jgi:hypothetical protein